MADGFLCICFRGNGTCKHVVAMLFAVEDFVTRHTDQHTAVGTDNTCVWDKPRKPSNPARITEVNFSKKPHKRTRVEPTAETYQPGAEVTLEMLRGDWRGILKGTESVANHVLDIDDCYHVYGTHHTYHVDYLNKYVVPECILVLG